MVALSFTSFFVLRGEGEGWQCLSVSWKEQKEEKYKQIQCKCKVIPANFFESNKQD